MKNLAVMMAVLLLAGCASIPQPQVNRAAKADKHAAPKQAAKAEMPTPNQIVKKRWFPRYKIQWLHK